MATDILSAINQLIGAINNLTLVQSQSVSVDCGCNVGQGPDNGEGSDGGPVPDPIGNITYDDPTPISDRKCKASDYVANWLRNTIFRDILVAYSIDEKASLGVVIALGLLGSIIGLIGGLAGAVVGGVGGLLIGAILAIIQQELDFVMINLVLDDNIQDLVCALYSASDVGNARDNFQQVLIDDGRLSTAEVSFTMLWLPNAILNMLYFDIVTPVDTAAFFDGYDLVTGCECGAAVTDWILMPANSFSTLGNHPILGSGTVVNTGAPFVIDAVLFQLPTTQNIYAVGLIVQGFWDTQIKPSNLDQINNDVNMGALEVLSMPGNPSTRGRRKVNCTTINTANPSAGPQVWSNGTMFIVWRDAGQGSFSMSFQVNSPPVVC